LVGDRDVADGKWRRSRVVRRRTGSVRLSRTAKDDGIESASVSMLWFAFFAAPFLELIFNKQSFVSEHTCPLSPLARCHLSRALSGFGDWIGDSPRDSSDARWWPRRTPPRLASRASPPWGPRLQIIPRLPRRICSTHSSSPASRCFGHESRRPGREQRQSSGGRLLRPHLRESRP